MRPIDQQLIKACQNGDAPTIKKLLHRGANPHIQDDWGKNALHYALEKKYHDIAQYLLTELKLDPNTQDQYGTTPLMLASRNGDINTLQLLVQHGANPHTTDHDGWTALHYALENRNPAIAKYLITELKLDPNTQNRYGITPLMIAAKKGDITMLKLLIQLGANPYATDRNGEDALHRTARGRCCDIAEYLITHLNFDPNAQDRWGRTPFLIAASKGDITMLKLLIQHGANPHATDHQGRNALHHAVEHNHHKAVFFLITRLHLDPNQQDHHGNIPLHIALKNGDIDTAKTLIRLGAKPHIPNHQGQTPTTIAHEHRTQLPKPQPSTISL